MKEFETLNDFFIWLRNSNAKPVACYGKNNYTVVDTNGNSIEIKILNN